MQDNRNGGGKPEAGNFSTRGGVVRARTGVTNEDLLEALRTAQELAAKASQLMTKGDQPHKAWKQERHVRTTDDESRQHSSDKRPSKHEPRGEPRRALQPCATLRDIRFICQVPCAPEYGGK